MSHPHVELPMPDPDPAWLRRFEAKMADLDAAREERQRTPPASDEQ